MKKIYLSILIPIISIPMILQGQPYEHAMGVRAGYSSGITYRGFFRYQMRAVELDAYYNRHGLNLSAYYQLHREPFRSKRWLIGAGAGPFGGKWDQEISLGISAIASIEFNLRDLPLNFGIDWKPMVNLYRYFETDLLDFGLTVRYRFSL